ncbi:MAG: VanZ family protein [Eubacterium sp.]|nr:VanZ family protein [Eubacterium sp.]
MDIITVLQAILRWGLPALAGGVAVFLVLALAYLIYKKVFHGNKKLSKMQIICSVLLCCWAILVIGLTSLSRGANYTGEINIDFFSGYISAWNNWSISELQLIIFNMLMFAPLGFLLPLLWKKAEKIWVTLSISFGSTALIEVVQLITGTGIFEFDDLFHNLIGSLFGYFCIMAILTPIREKTIRFAPIAKVLLIPCIVSLTLGAVFVAYDQQPYGNMSIVPAVKQDMSEIQIKTDLEFADKDSDAAIYKNKYAEDKNYIQDIKSQFAQLENLTFSNTTRKEDENYIYTGTDANGNEFQMNFFFRSGQWSYTTFADTTAKLTEKTAQKYRTRYETWMKENKLLPANAVFSVQNNDTLRWDVVLENEYSLDNKSFQEGSVMIKVDKNGTLFDLSYQISWNEYVTTEDIISANESFAQVKDGNFKQYVPFESNDNLYIEECELSYIYDTKGFYQPIYQFKGYVNNTENPWSCQIPAVEK